MSKKDIGMTQENTHTENPLALEEAKSKTVPIESIDQFAALVATWHERAVATIKHLSHVPEGMEVAIEGQENFKLEGEAHRGFVLGLELALNFVGTLPFAAEHEAPETIQ